MGCSPSKGQLFTGVSSHKALPPGSKEINTEIQGKTETDLGSDEITILEEETTLVQQGKGSSLSDTVCDTTAIKENGNVVTNVGSPEGLLAQDKVVGKDGRKKKNKGTKRSRQKDRVRKAASIHSKVDIPENMIKAHQAAYAYLNPSIPKFESLLGLLDQATKTQLSLQPMVVLLALHYEEINQGLEEMAVEGEQLLEEHGSHMAWPPALRDVLFNPKPVPDAELYSPEPPPDLLQQMLQHSTEKFRLIGDSVKGLGDAALEEAVEYFASLSRLLGEKLMVKKATERRLKQVLDRVEAAALRKSSLEDSALHSEDSGIGADNECQNGSVRLRRHRESSGSRASTGSSSGCPETLPVLPHLNRVQEDRKDDEDDDDEDDDDEDDDDEDDSTEDEEEAKNEQGRKPAVIERKMSDCSKADSRKHSLQNGMPPSASTSVHRRKTTIKRPKTADDSSVTSQGKPRRSYSRGLHRAQSADHLYCKVDDSAERDQEMKMNSEGIRNRFAGLGRTRLRSHSLEAQNTARSYGLQYGSKGPFRGTLVPSLPPAFAPAPPGRHAVKRLINTFSQGVQGKSKQEPIKGPMKIRGSKKGFLPMVSNSNGGVSLNGNNNNSCSTDQRFTERPDDVDVDSLPPPPPEVLMDNSFESSDENGTQNQGCSAQRQKPSVSQRLRASLQTVTVLPNRSTLPRRTQSVSPARPIRQDALVGNRPFQVCDQQTGDDAEKEEAANLYQRSRKIIHLQHPSDSPAKAGTGDQGIFRTGSVERQGSKDSGGNDSLAPYPNSYPPTTPPVSRARLPPSCPSVCHRVPSPPVLPPSRACGQWGVPATSSSSSVQRQTRRSDEENVSSSVSFFDARSVFCQEKQSVSQLLRPSCKSTLPRPWGEPSRGRLQTTRLPQTFMKSPSGVRPNITDQEQTFSSAAQTHSEDSERQDPSLVNTVDQEMQEICGEDPPSSQAGTGAQEAGSNQITDKQD